MGTIGADVSGAQSEADNALAIAEGLKGMTEDFSTSCEDAHSMFNGEPAVTGMDGFEVEYKSYMDEVQVQATDISDNIHAAGGEIGTTDDENREDFSGTYPGTLHLEIS